MIGLIAYNFRLMLAFYTNHGLNFASILKKETCYAANELEIGNVVWIAQARVGVDLECVVVNRRVLEEPVVRIEHFLR